MSIAVEPSVSARAGGKVILLGEHAVVYGSPAIALGLEQGAEVRVCRAAESSLMLGGERHVVGSTSEAGAAEPLARRAYRALLAEMGASGVSAEATLQIPAGAGLGASAALAVALARGVASLAALDGEAAGAAAPGTLARAALSWENVFHGNASGIDTAAAEHGGCLWFTRRDGAQPLAVGRALHVLVALVEPGASTRRMVEAVAERRRAQPSRVDFIVDAIAELTRQARHAIAGGAVAEVGQLMCRNQEFLVELGVSTPALEQACELALQSGALGAKLTGAGGGGCAIALVDAATRSLVSDAWARQGFVCLQAATTA
jgi:mevalonate kinase